MKLRKSNASDEVVMNDGGAVGGTAGKKVKAKKHTRGMSKMIGVISALLLVIGGILALNFYSSQQLRDTVDVVTLGSAVPQDGLITESNMVKATMSAQEYARRGIVTLSDGTTRRAIVLWEERSAIIDTYASYYIRQNTPIYWDVVSAQTPKQYSYLYNMDGELLKLAIDGATFGKMLVPGDHINIRASYMEQVFTLPTEEEWLMQQQTGISAQTSVQRQILLFSNVAIVDILNDKGESIFDMYYELLALSRNEQAVMVASEEFIEATQPAEILLCVTPEEADRYMSIQANSPTYMMTLLPRTESNAITEVLNELAVGFARG